MNISYKTLLKFIHTVLQFNYIMDNLILQTSASNLKTDNKSDSQWLSGPSVKLVSTPYVSHCKTANHAVTTPLH